MLCNYFSSRLKSLAIILLCTFTGFSQNLVQNGNFNSNISNWTSSISVCPNSADTQFQYYAYGQNLNLSEDWIGSAFLLNDIVGNNGDYASLQQNISGLVPAPGNKIKLKLDLLLGEAYTFNGLGIPAENQNDNITFEIYFNNVPYARVKTTKGWYNQTDASFGKASVEYLNGASSPNFAAGQTMNTIAGSLASGAIPAHQIGKNLGWEIEVPWECDKTEIASLDFRVYSDIYLGKTITDSQGETYTRGCSSSIYNALDNIGIDNVSIEPMNIPNTQTPLNNNLVASTCGQNSFNLASSMPDITNCTTLEYVFFKDINKTQEITTSTNYVITNFEESVYVFLAKKPNFPFGRLYSDTYQKIDLVKSPIANAGTIGSNYTLCSNTPVTEIVNLTLPSKNPNATYSYIWETATLGPSNIFGTFEPAGGINDLLNYMPTALSTPNEVITKLGFRRKILATHEGLTCTMFTSPVIITIDPCAPISTNVAIDQILNPSGTIYVGIPANQWLGMAGHASRTITNILLTKFPKNTLSLRLSPIIDGARVQATVYCANPADPACVGTAFPVNGVLIEANPNGQPTNTLIEVDPNGDGSFQIDVPYVHLDNLGFTSTNSNASILLTLAAPLPIRLKAFEASKINSNKIKLNWEVSQVQNFSHFEIEMAKDNNTFTSYSKVSFDEKSKYNFITNSLENGNYYFRLKLVDLNSKYSFSNIISSKIDNENYNDILLKNVGSSPTIVFDSYLPTNNYQIKVLDLKGRVLHTSELYLTENEENITIHSQNFKHGLYFISLTNPKNNIYIYKKILL